MNQHKLTIEDVIEIRAVWDALPGGDSDKELHPAILEMEKRYQVSRRHIRLIGKRKRWKEKVDHARNPN